ncbi:MAG: hypothetical protein IPH81_17670 [Candidatus Microthrix sp.]|jgi:hypothetical protein|nr:hypothetical protein [Candidatus Microthrix sp.]
MGAEHPPDNPAEGDESADGLSQELSRTAKRAAIEDRQAKVAELLLAEQPYRTIARVCDVSLGTVASDVAAIREQWRDSKMPDLEAHRDHVRSQLTRLMRALSTRAFGTKAQGPDVEAIREMRQLLADVRKLDGLDRPEQIHVSGRLSNVEPGSLDAMLEIAGRHAAGMLAAGRRVIDAELVE